MAMQTWLQKAFPFHLHPCRSGQGERASFQGSGLFLQDEVSEGLLPLLQVHFLALDPVGCD